MCDCTLIRAAAVHLTADVGERAKTIYEVTGLSIPCE